MIKTLRITSIVAAILAGIFFVFPVVFGVRSDERIEEFLNSPGVIERFNSDAGNKAKRSDSRTSPLVQQAKAFADYLNPQKRGTPAVYGTTGVTPSALPVTPRFRVIGTSYYQRHPELSLALIDEPGKGLHWVRQDSKVGHLTIEQVKEGLVVVRGSEGTFELVAEQKTETSLLEEQSPVPTATGGRTGPKPTLPASRTSGAGVTRASTVSPQPVRNVENEAKLKVLGNMLKELQKNFDSDKTDSGPSAEEKKVMMEELISKFQQSSRVSLEEAKRLGSLGRTLKEVQEDPNGALTQAKSGKTGAGR